MSDERAGRGTDHRVTGDGQRPAPWRLRRARAGVALAFGLVGAVYFTWAARLPAVKADLGLSDSQLAVVLVGLEAGALAGALGLATALGLPALLVAGTALFARAVQPSVVPGAGQAAAIGSRAVDLPADLAVPRRPRREWGRP